jgi:succinate dehydrogenase flavin-adding protein (antitoxin of CptAB toxin-antitoxin module)
MDCIMKFDNERIDISKKEELKRWSKLLRCQERDLVQAVLSIGSSVKMVDTFLYLNRKKMD